MKHLLYIFSLFFCLNYIQAQELREDDLGDVSDRFQSTFFEALKQKGIENYDKAIDLLIQCTKEAPNNASVYFELGKNYFELDQFQQAETALQKADKLKPNNPWVLEELYHLYKYQNKSSKAIETLEKLYYIKSFYAESLIEVYYQNGEYTKAINLINTLDTKYGIQKTREQLRHKIYTRNNNYNAQINYLKNKESLNPEDYKKLIYAYIKQKNISQGYNTALDFANKHPLSDDPYLFLYKHYLSNDNTKLAIEAMHRILKSNSLDDAEKFKILDDFTEFTSNNLNLLPELEKALQLFPHKTIAGKLALLYGNSDTEKYTEYTEVATENNSTDYEDLKLIGELLLQQGKIDEALKNSTKALELYPAQPVFYLQQAKAYNASNHAEKALKSLEFGLDYLIDNTVMEQEFYVQFAKAYQQMNDTKNEQKYLQKIKKLNG